MQKASQWMGVIVGLAVLIPTQAIASSSTWVRVVKDTDSELFIDQASIKQEGQYRTFWSYIAFSQPKPVDGKKVYGQGDYLTVDCKTKQYQVRYKRFMDQNNKLIKEFNFGSSSSLTRTRSKNEMAGIKFACAQRD
jgi:hypothetical protein